MFKILDAPNLLDDFYIHILSWSSNNIISIALNNDIYLLNYENNNVSKLCNFENQITSLNFCKKENFLAVGLNDGNLNVYDINKFYSQIQTENLFNGGDNFKIQTSCPHRGRIGIIINNPNNPDLITTGSIDHKIKLFDLRKNIKKPIKIFNGHSQEICGLAYNLYGNNLISGGNDNNLNIWDISYEDKSLANIEKAHHSAIRAIDCSKIKNNIFITGGGVNDRKIKVWNFYNFNVINQIETNAQICDIKFSKFNNEFITTNGYNNYLLNFWNFDDKYKFNLINSNKSHKNRILYIDVSKDNEQTVVTGSGDETIRFWKIFSEYKEKSPKKSTINSINEYNSIR
jgi:cell division cycle 20-like protein 1 (cofactor of APC complex)